MKPLLQCRYQEIAEHAFNVIQKRAVHEGRQKQKLRHAPQPLNLFIAQEVYRVLLFAIFLAQVAVVRHVPYIGENDCSTRPCQQMDGCTFLCSELCKLAEGKSCNCQYSSCECAEASALLHLVTCCCLFSHQFRAIYHQQLVSQVVSFSLC